MAPVAPVTCGAAACGTAVCGAQDAGNAQLYYVGANQGSYRTSCVFIWQRLSHRFVTRSMTRYFTLTFSSTPRLPCLNAWYYPTVFVQSRFDMTASCVSKRPFNQISMFYRCLQSLLSQEQSFSCMTVFSVCHCSLRPFRAEDFGKVRDR